jgi:hypothetical protein
MRYFIIVCGAIITLASSAYSWFPGFIQNSKSYQGSSSTINIASGTIQTPVLGQIELTPDYETLIASQTSITPSSTSSFMILGSTQNVTIGAGASGNASISTTSINVGHYLILTSTSVTVTMPAGSGHYLVGVSSPVNLVKDSVLSVIYNGNYWICISSNSIQ